MNIPKELIIDLLENYARYKAILEQLRLENDVSIPACIIRDTPRSVTNKFYSVTENLAIWKPEQEELRKNICLVDNWLGSLSFMHRFIMQRFYIERYTYRMLTEDWRKMYGDIHDKVYWSAQKKLALKAISEFYKKNNDPITN
jgi:hypothetical protein